MLLTITNFSPPATDIGFLLHKNPAALRSVDVGFGVAHVLYPEAKPDRCTVALVVEIDPVGLVRRSRGGPFPLAAYVNDRPYAASSLMSVALRKVFGTAMRGQCKERPELVAEKLDLTAHLPVLRCRGGEELLRQLFEPLGYQVNARAIPLDPKFPAWGESPYFDVRLSAPCPVRDLLGHLYVLVPVLDDDKHYWVTKDEIDKLVEGAGEWLAGHPGRDVIVRRYLRHQHGLAREAIARLLDEDTALPGSAEEAGDGDGAAALAATALVSAGGQTPERGATTVADHAKLRDLRVTAVISALSAASAKRVLDLGCGDGRLLAALLANAQFEEIVGVDACAAALERAVRRLRLDEMAPRQRARIRLLHSALTYSDRRLAGYDAAVLMEVIEHVDPDRLPALEQAVLGGAAPGTVIITTPNAEYNVRYPQLALGGRRHPDHRFEWGRAEFRAWAHRVAGQYGYSATFEPVGEADPDTGPPTQMAVLRRTAQTAGAASTAQTAETAGSSGTQD
jgi:3' terminal RNA ribose 2'-O-methyltransferase Hen1